MGSLRVRVREPAPEAAAALGRALQLSPSIAQVLLHRGLSDEQAARAFLSPKLADLSPPHAMAGRSAAAERLAAAVRSGETIVVFGDYDVDGTTSAAILGGILELLGGRVAIRLASRFDGGYGLSEAALERVLALRPSVLVTCDCGSSDHARLELAAAAGVDAIVVDHHLVPETPLPALAFLNPRRPECGFAFKDLCSAGLALSLAAEVRARLGKTIDLRPWLDLVALGTIADVVPLLGDNRRLVRAGLAQLASPEGRPGIIALRELAKIKPGSSLPASDVAFRIAPRLNAAGRLGDPTLSLELLRARTLPEARALAARLEQHNDQRKALEAGITAQAIEQVRALYGEAPDCAVVAAAEGWHRGVIGITAARLCDHFGVPAVAIALEGGEGHGSARSFDGFALFDAISECAENLERFGGHQVASGLSLRSERVEAFRGALRAVTQGRVTRAPEHGVVSDVDVVIGDGGYPLPSASELAQLEPLGEGNPEPVFLLRKARVEASSVVGQGHLKLRLLAGDRRLSAFGLDMGPRKPEVGAVISALGPLRPDTWTGGESVELRLQDFE
ncbi:MAG: single-stranded-DNA-specific exonuclease RecJ [Polyangiales bacterium]